MFKRLVCICVFALLPLSAQLVHVVSTVQPGGVPFNGRMLVSCPALTYNGEDYDPMSAVPYTITAGALDISLPPNLGATPASTYYTVQFIPRTGGGQGWTETWQIPVSASTLSRRDVVVSTFTNPGAINFLPPYQIARSGAQIGWALRWNGAYYAPAADPPSSGGGGGGAVSSVFGRIGAVLFQAGDATTALVTESGNLYFTPARAIAAMNGLYISPPAGSVADTALALFDGTTGKLLKASSLTGVLKLTAGVPSVVTGAATDCVRVNGTSGACGNFIAGIGMNILADTLSIDTSMVPRYAATSGLAGYAATAGSEWRWNTSTNFLYVANGTTLWDLVYKAGTQIMRADIPPSASTGYGGVQDIACADGSHIKTLSAGAFTCTPDSGGGGGGTTGFYSATLNFSSAIAPGACAIQTFTATGLAAGRALSPGWPSGLPAYLEPRAKASATNTVEVQLCNRGDGDVTPGSASYNVRDVASLGYLSASASIDWGNLSPGQCSTNTLTITGAAAGDSASGGWPAALATGITPRVLISAANTATIQLCSHLDGDYDPPSGTYTVAVSK